jgi:hypothetical protein
MRLSTFISLFLLFTRISFGQTREQKFNVTVQQIIIAFSKQDSATISKYIDKKIGLYQLDRVGVFDNYNHFNTFSFSDTSYPQVLFRQSKNVTPLPLQYASLPTWDCENETWSKKGLFVDTTRTDHLLSKICKDRNKVRPDNIPNKTIQFFYDLETKSRRMVLYDNKDIELVFYLSYLNGKWFLTIIDNVTSDCSV